MGIFYAILDPERLYNVIAVIERVLHLVQMLYLRDENHQALLPEAASQYYLLLLVQLASAVLTSRASGGV